MRALKPARRPLTDVRGREAEDWDSGVRQTGVQIPTPAFTSSMTYLNLWFVEWECPSSNAVVRRN